MVVWLFLVFGFMSSFVVFRVIDCLRGVSLFLVYFRGGVIRLGFAGFCINCREFLSVLFGEWVLLLWGRGVL